MSFEGSPELFRGEEAEEGEIYFLSPSQAVRHPGDIADLVSTYCNNCALRKACPENIDDYLLYCDDLAFPPNVPEGLEHRLVRIGTNGSARYKEILLCPKFSPKEKP